MNKLLFGQNANKFSAFPSSLNFSENGGSINVEIIYSSNWEITTSDDWITFNKTSGFGSDNVLVNVSLNPFAENRNGSFIIHGNELEQINITVQQLGS